MKKLVLFITIIFTLNTFSQTTLIPDPNFELHLFNMGYDNALDGQVLTTNISSITFLNMTYENISDLTGIQDFIALEYLDFSGNNLTYLDISQNTALTHLQCDNNQLTSLDVSQNIALNYLHCDRNQLTTLDVSQNIALTFLCCKGFNCTAGVGNNLTYFDVSHNTSLISLDIGGNSLTSLNVSQNTALDALYCGKNLLSSLDLSNNTALTFLDCDYNLITSLDMSQNIALGFLYCNNNQLECLNVKNGNNSNFDLQAAFDASVNPNLTCITVDNVTWSTANWTVGSGEIDLQTSFSTDCGNFCSLGLTELNSNLPKKLTKIIDLTGREIPFSKNTVMIYVYEDGSSEKIIEIE